MNVRLLILSAIVILMLGGCRKDPHMQVYIDNMNAEKRLLEDTMYDLQYDYENKVAEVEKLRQELEKVKSGGTSVLSSPDSSSSGGQSGSDAPRDLFPETPDLKPPTIDPGTPSESKAGSGGGGEKKKPSQNDADEDNLQPPQLDLGKEKSVSAAAMPLNQQITRLYVNPARTGGLQRDQRPGDDGVVLVVEPRNNENTFVPVAGRISVVLLDPESRRRVARWEFSKEQIAVALQKNRSTRGIELKMPWQDTPPTESRVHLFVRYWLPDGQAVQGDREITLAPHGQLTARWTPRTEKRTDPPSRRVNVAEKQDTAAPAAANDAQGRNETTDPQNVVPPHAKQARLPQWRPYR